MGFDKTKVQFSDLELEVGRAFDEIYEKAVEEFGDGVDVSDFFGLIKEVWGEYPVLRDYFAEAEDVRSVGEKFANIGFMMLRDNLF